MSYVYSFGNRPGQDGVLSDLERSESTSSPDIDAIELRPVVKKPECFELREISPKKEKGESGMCPLPCEEIDQEQVFENLTLRRSFTRPAVRPSLEGDPTKEVLSIDSERVSPTGLSKPDEDVSERADLTDSEITESETSSTDSEEGFDHVQSLLPSFTSVLYSKDHVAMFPQKNTKLSGRLSIIKQNGVVFFTWKPSQNDECKSMMENENLYAIPPLPLSEIRAITRHTPTLGWHYIILVLINGCTFPPLYFNNGGVRSLLLTLKQNASIVRAIDDPNTYLINESPDPLKKSLHSMDLDDILLGCLADNDRSLDGNAFTGAFSKLKKIALDTTSNWFYSEPADKQTAPACCNPQGMETSDKEEVLDTQPSLNNEEPKPMSRSISIQSASHKGTPSIDSTRSFYTEVGSFELLDGLVARPTDRLDALKAKKDWGKVVNAQEFGSFFDNEGCLVKTALFRERIFYGGFSPELRKQGWKYLFGLWKEDWTKEMCERVSKERMRHYYSICNQWQSITPDQERRFAKWRDRKSKIDKDVRRTDRCQSFYKHEHGEQLKALKRILSSYVMYNFDLSYCQGMSDLASPILYVMMADIQNKDSYEWKLAEAEAFWCFSGMMDRVESNFDVDQRGMHSQLLALEKLLQLLDPQLYAHFKLHDCLNFFFCFRWVLILFKREFTFDDVLRLWESFFSRHKTRHFHLYLCIAVLVTHRNTVLQEDMDFEGLLKFCLELSGKIALMPMLKLANVLSAWAEPIEQDCLADIF